MFFLTYPDTKIIIPGETQPQLLGMRAVNIMRTLATARSRIADTKTTLTKSQKETLFAKAKEVLEPKLRKQIESELLKKFKTRSDGYTSLDDIPEASNDDLADGRVLSEDEYAKLSPDAKERYLRGY